jgi:hypothetical protein
VNFDTQLLTSDREPVTRARLREALDDLFADPAEVALLYLSGHGTENDLGGYLVITDAARYDEGVPLADVLAHANRATHITGVAIIVDSCHSGWLGTVPAANNAHAALREGLSILGASRPSQASLGRGEDGVFTELVCSALAGGAADILGNVSVAGVYAVRRSGLRRMGSAPAVQVARVAHAVAADGEARRSTSRSSGGCRSGSRRRTPTSPFPRATSTPPSQRTRRPKPSSVAFSAATASSSSSRSTRRTCTAPRSAAPAAG